MIKLYSRRSFNQKLSDTFDFAKENWKPLFRLLSYFVLPISIIEAFFMMTPRNDVSNSAIIRNLSGTGFINIIAGIVIIAAVYGYMKLYEAHREGLAGISFKDFYNAISRCYKRACIASLFTLLIVVIAVGIIAVLASIYSDSGINAFLITFLILLTLAFIACIFSLVLIFPVYLFEDDLSITAAFVKAMRLGFKTWAGIFGLTIFIGVLVSLLTFIVAIPYFIIIFLTTTLDIGSSNIVMNILSFIFTALMLFGSYMFSTLSIIALAYQYGHAAEKIDGASVEKDVEDFEETV
jgi:hypothetical protein